MKPGGVRLFHELKQIILTKNTNKKRGLFNTTTYDETIISELYTTENITIYIICLTERLHLKTVISLFYIVIL